MKAVKAIAPKGPKLKEAFATAAKYGIKKGAMGKLGQGQTMKLMKELKDEHVLKSRIGNLTTAGATARHIVEAATSGPGGNPHPDPSASREERASQRQKTSEAMRAKTLAEHPDMEKPALSEARKRELVRSGRESAEAAQAETEKRDLSGHGKPGEGHAPRVRESADILPVFKPASVGNGESKKVAIPASYPSSRSEEDLEKGGVSETPSRNTDNPGVALPQEPANAKEAMDMDIG